LLVLIGHFCSPRLSAPQRVGFRMSERCGFSFGAPTSVHYPGIIIPGGRLRTNDMDRFDCHAAFFFTRVVERRSFTARGACRIPAARSTWTMPVKAGRRARLGCPVFVCSGPDTGTVAPRRSIGEGYYQRCLSSLREHRGGCREKISAFAEAETQGTAAMSERSPPAHACPGISWPPAEPFQRIS